MITLAELLNIEDNDRIIMNDYPSYNCKLADSRFIEISTSRYEEHIFEYFSGIAKQKS